MILQTVHKNLQKFGRLRRPENFTLDPLPSPPGGNPPLPPPLIFQPVPTYGPLYFSGSKILFHENLQQQNQEKKTLT